MMTHEEMIAVIQHHKNGGKVESLIAGDWKILTNEPSWNFYEFRYRPHIEPKTKQVITLETWLCAFRNEYCISEATAGYFEGIKTVKLLSTREVEL